MKKIFLILFLFYSLISEAQVAVRNSVGSNNAGGGSTIVMTMPTNVDLDVLIMQITVVGGTGTVITTPSGWNLLNVSNSTTALKQAVYWRIASSEPASYTVSITSNKASGTITSLSGATVATAVEFLSNSLYSDAGLVAYYKLEDENDSKGSNNLTNNGSTPFNSAKFGNGADLGTSNTTKYLQVASDLGIAGNADITISGWVKLNAEITTGFYFLFDHRSTTGLGRFFAASYQFSSSTDASIIVNASGTSSTASILLGTAQWYHIAITRNVSGNSAKIYVNGVLVAQGALGSSSNLANTFTIGATTGATSKSNAIFDDVAVFNRVLTDAEILSISSGYPASYSVNASSSTVTAASLPSFTSTNGIDLFLGGTATGTTAANPTNYSTGSSSASTGGGAGTRTTSGISYRSLSSVTTVGSLTATYGAAAVNIGHHIFINEAVAGVTPTTKKLSLLGVGNP